MKRRQCDEVVLVEFVNVQKGMADLLERTLAVTLGAQEENVCTLTLIVLLKDAF